MCTLKKFDLKNTSLKIYDFEQRPEWRGQASDEKLSQQTVSGRGNNKDESP